ncbi:MAG: hypothetical protein CMH27_10955 [Micavibrio sp.]|nr:hypothetical protein [Micavibrio sp.]|tara:strand:+ start:656 stop:895 length:240 start_codon:yes stop_codon:yes gene_type:complete
MTERFNPRIEDHVLRATFAEHAAGGNQKMVARFDANNNTVSVDGGDHQPIQVLDMDTQEPTASAAEPLNQPLSLNLGQP